MDPRMSQSYLQQRSPPPPQHQQRNSRMQSYNMDQIPRPRPPTHHQQYSPQPRPFYQQQQPRMQSPNYQPTRGQYQPSRQSTQQQQQQPRMQGRPMRPPPPQPPLIGRRNNTMNRTRSLSRPERQRPRQGMFRSPSQQQRLQNHVRGYPMRPPPNQPMSNSLQYQLQQQKLQQQQEAIQPAAPLPNQKSKQKEPEEDIKVLTNWWAWIAFLMTCCIPNWFLKVCLRKRNPLVQQAWREKVKKSEKKKNPCSYFFCHRFLYVILF